MNNENTRLNAAARAEIARDKVAFEARYRKSGHNGGHKGRSVADMTAEHESQVQKLVEAGLGTYEEISSLAWGEVAALAK